MSAYPEIQQVKMGLSKLGQITVMMTVAFSITIAGVLLFLWNTGAFDHAFVIHNSDGFQQDSSTSNIVQNDKKAAASNTVRIGTSNIEWYTLATVDIPFKIIAGRQVNFILDLADSPSSTNSIVVTITDNEGQHVLFFPRSNAHNLVDEVQFQYTFPLSGKYNVDITFGGPAAANFNVFVANSESVI